MESWMCRRSLYARSMCWGSDMLQNCSLPFWIRSYDWELPLKHHPLRNCPLHGMRENNLPQLLIQDNCSHLWIVQWCLGRSQTRSCWQGLCPTDPDTLALPGTVRFCLLNSKSNLIERRQNWLLPSNHSTFNWRHGSFASPIQQNRSEEIGKTINCWIGSVSAVATKALPNSQLPRASQNLQSC